MLYEVITSPVRSKRRVRKKNRKTTRINLFFQLIHQEGLTPPQVFDIFSKSLKLLESLPSTSKPSPVTESTGCRLSGPIQPDNGLTVSDSLYPRFCHDSPLLWGIYDASFSRIFPGQLFFRQGLPRRRHLATLAGQVAYTP